MPDLPPALVASLFAVAGGGFGLLWTALLLGIRHGIDWDHIAAIADITSTSTAADAGAAAHELSHRSTPHAHAHGGPDEVRVHGGGGASPPSAASLPDPAVVGSTAFRQRERLLAEQRHAILLGTLYALGHALVVAILGLAALSFGALLPEWVDPIMGRVVGVTLVLLGIWVFTSLYQYARHGTEFRLRSRWLLLFDGLRFAWRRFQAWLHGHEHVEPVEMSAYGPRTAFGVGMIHGIGAETGSQVLIIAAIGGAAGQGLGVPMMVAFIVGLLASNTLVIVVTATGFIASQLRQRIYLVVGVIAGAFSLVVGFIFLFELDALLPDIGGTLGSLGT